MPQHQQFVLQWVLHRRILSWTFECKCPIPSTAHPHFRSLYCRSNAVPGSKAAVVETDSATTSTTFRATNLTFVGCVLVLAVRISEHLSLSWTDFLQTSNVAEAVEMETGSVPLVIKSTIRYKLNKSIYNTGTNTRRNIAAGY
jgi:hypothetical protein